MVIKSKLSPLQNRGVMNEPEHVLITEYLTGTNKTKSESKIDEYNTIAVSPNDHRYYRLIELRNGLHCLMVTNNYQDDGGDDEENEESDQDYTDDKLNSSDADQVFLQYHMTTVALYIPAGSFLDPSNQQGLAHLTEHLLFSSSSKYPEMNCLDAFISYHGGAIHAYTELEFTVIVIEISSNRVVEALDILLHSIIDPLMLSEAIIDQIKIIDEESAIAQHDDHYRATHLLASLARSNHPIVQFSWGNKKSLKDLLENDQSTNILKQFVRDRYYIPEGMNLVMISNESFRVMQQRIERLFCLLKRSLSNFAQESKQLFYTAQNILKLGPVPRILLPSLRAVQLPAQKTIVKVESYESNDCSTYLMIFFEHGIASIRDYVLIEILAETIEESLDDYLKSAGQHHFTCHVTLRDTYGIISLQIQLIFSSEAYNSMDVLDYVSNFFILLKDVIMETTKNDFDRLLNMFRNAKQTLDNSLQTSVDRYWTEILLNSLIFDRNTREREVLDTLTVTDMQQWYDEHIISSTRRQLILIVFSNDEIQRSKNGIQSHARTNHDNQRNRFSLRSSFNIPNDRLPRMKRRPDLSGDNYDEIHMSLLKSKSDSKLRCLTTKRKHQIDLRSTKSETIHLHQPLNYPNDSMKLDYIIKSFESIEINDENRTNQYRQSLKILTDFNSQDSSYFTIRNLRLFKDSCLLYNTVSIK